MSRVARNTTLSWKFCRPTFFPSCSYDFPKLRSLLVHYEDETGNSNHLSLKGHLLLPEKPMKELTTLDLNFGLSSRLLLSESLSIAFPNLTSLSIQPLKNFHDMVFPTLPKSIRHLKILRWTDNHREELNCQIFKSLPEGLESLTLRVCRSSPVQNSFTSEKNRLAAFPRIARSENGLLARHR